MGTGKLTDSCSMCGRFVGRYPVGFYCDTHCHRCVCNACPEFRGRPDAVYAAQAENSRRRATERAIRAAA